MSAPEAPQQPSSPVVDPEAVERLAKALHDAENICGTRATDCIVTNHWRAWSHDAELVLASDWLAELRREAAERGWEEGKASTIAAYFKTRGPYPPSNPYRREEQKR